MKLSYAICVCTEHRELDTLLDFLTQVKDEEDEIVVLVDNTKDCKEVTMVLARYNGLCISRERLTTIFRHTRII